MVIDMKRAVTVLFILMLILLAGCNTTNNETTGKTFIGGTKGLEISFLQDSPPDEAFDGGQQPFDVTVELSNVGEYTAPKQWVKAKLSGLSPFDFFVPAEEFIKIPDEDLEMSYKDPDGNKIEGTKTTITFSNLDYKGLLSGPTEFPIRVDVCYKYGTTAEAKLCVKENLLNTREKAVCTVTEEKSVENSGSPVHVASFKEFAKAKDKIGFTFIIDHVGDGSIFKRETFCNAGSASIVDENRVWININTGPSVAKCAGLTGGGDNYGYVVLYKGTDKSDKLSRPVTCTLDLPPSTTAYETVVKINLEYDYKEFVSKQIIIKHG